MKTSRSTPTRRQSANPATTSLPLRWSAFDTPLGQAALVWSEADPQRRLRGALLPGEATPAAVVERFPGATESPIGVSRLRKPRLSLPCESTPAAVGTTGDGSDGSACSGGTPAPAWVRAVARRLVAHLRGRYDPLTDVALDLDGASPFDQTVWAAAREVPPGEVLSYGDLASRVGRPGAARAVGGAMGRNRVPFIIPCHRIVAASGLGGFSSALGLTTKVAMLRAEGVDTTRRVRVRST